MIILDTNVVSELMKINPSIKVIKWVASYSPQNLFTTTITQAEILYGLAILPLGKRRNDLEESAQKMFEVEFKNRVLAFDTKAAIIFSEIAAKRRQLGKPISQADAQIAAIAKSYGASIATRNVSDFEDCNILIINPWSE
ncbi:type II toxin-antitoxin system VapC family toxin [Dactylococcopsis salina]|uniref:Ribonuclease VapC n=1 Tax=Dactylococcopsis salina (strain PCC 8305) TaxID=13035 RepID=K9YV11_DACS8|nr:type II toxin-antitoxin system VapC family toxin [Dactylococcopsis salina]AFZ50170.1 putative nucleic acid-binding protein, contains PIN domain [Dactylococcopsis salina PCC 8305]